MPLGKTPRKGYTAANYKDALTPEQALKMSQFLHDLATAGEVAKRAGVKQNVELFMKAYKGLPVTAEGRKERRRSMTRERNRAWNKRVKQRKAC